MMQTEMRQWDLRAEIEVPAKALLDKRTLDAYLTGRPVRPSTVQRLKEAAVALGYVLPEPLRKTG
jgi:hypothetical protein